MRDQLGSAEVVKGRKSRKIGYSNDMWLMCKIRLICLLRGYGQLVHSKVCHRDDRFANEQIVAFGPIRPDVPERKGAEKPRNGAAMEAAGFRPLQMNVVVPIRAENEDDTFRG
jgi:hypothetical protein